MKVYLAASCEDRLNVLLNARGNSVPYVLGSHAYPEALKAAETAKAFNSETIIDSGAFTFIDASKSGVNWDDYVERYADYINRSRHDHFVELDIYSLIGVKETERLRRKLEALTKRLCLPVWHKPLGIDYFKKMVKQYPYICTGGLTSEITGKEWNKLPALINYANKHKVKVHGLGFTKTKMLKTFRYYSVDSSTWTFGARFARYQIFDGTQIVSKSRPAGTRAKKGGIEITEKSLSAWIQYAHYMKGR